MGWFTVGNTRFSRLTSATHIYLFWIKMSVITKFPSITSSFKWFMCSLFNCRFGKCPLLLGNWHIMTWILEEIIDIQKQWISITFPVRSLVWLCIKLSLGSLIYLIQGKVEQELLYKKGHFSMFAHIRQVKKESWMSGWIFETWSHFVLCWVVGTIVILKSQHQQSITIVSR